MFANAKIFIHKTRKHGKNKAQANAHAYTSPRVAYDYLIQGGAKYSILNAATIGGPPVVEAAIPFRMIRFHEAFDNKILSFKFRQK